MEFKAKQIFSIFTMGLLNLCVFGIPAKDPVKTLKPEILIFGQENLPETNQLLEEIGENMVDSAMEQDSMFHQEPRILPDLFNVNGYIANVPTNEASMTTIPAGAILFGGVPVTTVNTTSI